MIKSMTGFGAGDAETADFKVHIEVKAVNQRFLETNYHMPYSMNMFDAGYGAGLGKLCSYARG